MTPDETRAPENAGDHLWALKQENARLSSSLAAARAEADALRTALGLEAPEFQQFWEACVRLTETDEGKVLIRYIAQIEELLKGSRAEAARLREACRDAIEAAEPFVKDDLHLTVTTTGASYDQEARALRKLKRARAALAPASGMTTEGEGEEG